MMNLPDSYRLCLSDVSKYPIKTSIEGEGQLYLDSPIYKFVSRVKTIVLALSAAFNYSPPADIKILEGYNRDVLEWQLKGAAPL